MPPKPKAMRGPKNRSCDMPIMSSTPRFHRGGSNGQILVGPGMEAGDNKRGWKAALLTYLDGKSAAQSRSTLGAFLWVQCLVRGQYNAGNLCQLEVFVAGQLLQAA